MYLARDLWNDNEKKWVAIKTESIKQQTPQLLKEIQSFKAIQGGLGIPKYIKEGISAENNVLYMALQLMGPSLKDLLTFCGKKFSLKTTLMIFY